MLNSLRRDVLYGVRTLARNPSFACVSILALALGIGANTAVFTVVNSVLLQPLHFYKPDQLTMVRDRNLKAGFPQFSLSPGNYLDYRDHNHTFSGIAAFGGASMNFSGSAEPERLRGSRVTNEFFQVLGASPVLGRTFTPQESQLGSQFVIILSHALWERTFAGSRDALGKKLNLNDNLYTVVGVMPRDFQFPARTEFWIPLAMNLQNWQQRGGHYLSGIGRLRDGVAMETAHADLNQIAARAEKENPQSNAGWDTTLQSLQEASVGKVRPAMVTLTAAVGFVLLIACVNLANLLLSRSAARRREIGIRNALGAGRARLVRQLLTESSLLSILGAAVGLGLAYAGTRLLVTLTPDILPRAAEIGMDVRVLLFTAAIAVFTGVLFGLAPAIQMARTDVNSALREGGRGNAMGFRRNRLRSVLVIGEVALALVLLSGAGLLMRSFYRLQGVDPGFDTHNVLTFRTNLPAARYAKPEQTVGFYDRALQRLRELPGVTAAGAGQIFPLAGDDYILSFEQVGKPPLPPGNQPSAAYYSVTDGFFEALRIPMKTGRPFNAHDTASSQPVAIISEQMARQFYHGENPIGQHLKVGNGSDKPAEIVGIAGDIRDQELESFGRPAIYYPATQDPFGSMYFGVRTAGDPAALITAVRAAIRGLDAELPLDAVGTVDGSVSKSLSQRRFSMLLMAIFASLALILAVIGIYGVMAYSVTQATQEIGIRMALGAGRAEVLRIVLGYAGLLLAVGLGLGLAAAAGAGRLLAAQLFEVKPFDALTFAAVAAALVLTGLTACLVPAFRAMRVDPLIALRNE
ncbi:MAG TPA: ABC transporter permease [Candidatus Sulfopaludibacter sp.]|jgi:putative ABC transport system permease protein|nr:ABC transporter permease [Candidatus Sulfopaludibacter sp.]